MVSTISETQLKEVFKAATEILRSKKEIVNNLNVFPVPDGDTGTNMLLTLSEIDKAISRQKPDTLSKLTSTISEASLMGARGNSGVILSQFIGGFCEVIKAKDSLDFSVLQEAFEKGSKEAYASVSDPKEGTILTVMRSASSEFEKHAKSKDIAKTFVSVIRRAQLTLKETPELLPTLKEAGVVDAGGAGFVYFLEGFHTVLSPNDMPIVTSTDDFASPPISRMWEETSGVFGTGGLQAIIDFNLKAIKYFFRNLLWIYKKAWHVIKTGKSYVSLKKAVRLIIRLGNSLKLQNIKSANTSILRFLDVWKKRPSERYCYEVILTDMTKPTAVIKSELSKIGTSLIVAEQGKFTKIHFHINNVTDIDKKITTYGKIYRKKVEDMHNQQSAFIEHKFDEDEGQAGTAVIAVINGKGFKEIYESFQNVHTINGGKTMNPSVRDFKNSIAKIDSPNLIILPNNPNVFLTAQRTLATMKHQAQVLQTFDQAQGLTALLSFNKEATMKTNTALMSDALKNLITFSVTSAVKDSSISGKKIKHGEFISIGNKSLIASHIKLDEVIVKSIEKLATPRTQLISLYTGKDTLQSDITAVRTKLQRAFKYEVQLYSGGQPNYQFIVSLE